MIIKNIYNVSSCDKFPISFGIFPVILLPVKSLSKEKIKMMLI